MVSFHLRIYIALCCFSVILVEAVADFSQFTGAYGMPELGE